MQVLRNTGIDLMLCPVRKGTLDKMEGEFMKHYDCREENRWGALGLAALW